MRNAKLALALVASLTALTLPAAPAHAASAWWQLLPASRPTVLEPGAKGEIVLIATNLGDATADGELDPIVIETDLPPGVEAQSVSAIAGESSSGPLNRGPVSCSKGPPVSCTFSGSLPPFDLIEVRIKVAVLPAVEAGEETVFTVSGGDTLPASVTRALQLGEEGTPFGLDQYQLAYEEEGGPPVTQAGSHPFQQTATIAINQKAAIINHGGYEARAAALPKDVAVELPVGLAGNPSPFETCTLAKFLVQPVGVEKGINECPAQTAVGVDMTTFDDPGILKLATQGVPIFNLEPAAGEPARFGFLLPTVPVLIDTALRSGAGEDYGVTASTTNISQVATLLSSQVTFWGVPGDHRHDNARGWGCLEATRVATPEVPCMVPQEPHPPALLTLPTSCTGPLASSTKIDSWADPGAFVNRASSPMQALDGCNRLPFAPAVHAEPTSDAATTGTGFSFDLNFNDEGLTNAEGLAQSQMKKAVVTLPQGFTANPSVAEGLQACSQAEYEAATASVGSGCTPESKIGEVEIESPLVVGKKVTGGLYVARQHENPYGNLLTLYLIARNEELGVLVRQALKVTPDPVTGQLTTEVDDVPQLPFSRFHLQFRSGQRSPLITPPACGAYAVKAKLYPWSAPGEPVERESSFQITQGPEGQGCPSGGLPPFHPGLEAGTINNAAGTYSPFYVHMTRKDSEQEITHFSIKLPPGVTGKLAGVQQCSDAAIAAAKAREHEGGGQEELQSPSCPAGSEIGRTKVGTGVGNVLAYVPGKVYLAGPYHGSPISIAAITAAKVGPFDLGTVVVREALRVNSETGEVFVDATGSDPIPHIVDGIPVHLRDIRVYVDRPEFVLNPTSCKPTSTASTLLGAGLDFSSEADDNPITVSSRFQAADCAALGFKPKIAFSLKGGTRRNQFPAFKAVVEGRPGDANIARSEVVLPKSEILEQGHIGTSCTRVQFNEGAGNGAGCPANSIYGRARAITPILSEPLEGPVYLRSNGGERNLPDLVASLHGQEININLVGFIDSVLTKNKHGETVSRIRNRFQTVPDAPVTKFTLEMFGGKKGLLVNSHPLCKGSHRAEVNFTAHNGKVEDLRPALKTSCPKKDKGKKRAR